MGFSSPWPFPLVALLMKPRTRRAPLECPWRAANAVQLLNDFSWDELEPQEVPFYSLGSKSGRFRRVFSIDAARRHLATSACFPPMRTSGTGHPRSPAGRV